MGRLIQGIMGALFVIIGCLGILNILPFPDIVIPNIWWGVGMILLALSWR